MAFYWIGVAVVFGAGIIAIMWAAIYAYMWLIHGRFGLILFRKGERRISISSWENSKLMNNPYFRADDWLINRHPFYLSYNLGNRRLFVMAGMLGPVRYGKVKGEHPEQIKEPHP